jgi:Domain of unknown function (DUF4262)
MKKIDDFWKGTLDIISKKGWAVQGVMGGKASPSFCYSIGMSAKDLPELLIVGLDVKMAGHFINGICEKMIDGSCIAKDGEFVAEVANVPLQLRELDFNDVENIMYGAIRFNKTGKPLKFIQVIFPDEKGFFPGDSRCEKKYSDLQSLKDLKKAT